ncbi:hypothetical protein AMTR_s00022p00051710 [Amborella trichopoda]|uniref:RING-type domain-containing protein n=1 Tax=Amborella trichopoda TaxID=13333 RepID=W1PN27_AMBTC|nr:hypothetical protein AMTR_s00022p00051710 [Amborella trichopoda]
MMCLSLVHLGWHVLALILYTCFFLPHIYVLDFIANLTSPKRCMQRPACLHVSCSDEAMVGSLASWEEDNHVMKYGEKVWTVDSTCSVCLGEFGEREEGVTRLKACGHVFHVACIQRWFQLDRFTCPLCRVIFFRVDQRELCT